MRRIVSVLLLIAACALGPDSASGQRPKLPKQPDPQPPASLPKELVTAWEQAGASPGWVRVDQYPIHFRKGGGGYGGDMPAFAFSKWEAGAFAKLPTPDQPFGLFLGEALVTDADLKAIATFSKLRLFESYCLVSEAKLKQLATVAELEAVSVRTTATGDAAAAALGGLKKLRSYQVLADTPLTEAGLKTVGGLADLHDLSLTFSGTVAEMKHLAGLKELWRLEIGSTAITDDGLKEIATLRHLDYLNLNSATLTDVGLKHLAGFELLRELHLGNQERITDAGLKELAALKNLRKLSLNHTPVNGSGLAALADLKELAELDLGGSNVTDAGLKGVAQLTRLHSLYLSGTKVTNAGLKELAALPNLLHLHIGNRAITDEGLKDLAGLKKLNGLNLYGASVTDEGLKVLGTFPALAYVDVRGTSVTADGIAASRKAKPKLNVTR